MTVGFMKTVTTNVMDEEYKNSGYGTSSITEKMKDKMPV